MVNHNAVYPIPPPDTADVYPAVVTRRWSSILSYILLYTIITISFICVVTLIPKFNRGKRHIPPNFRLDSASFVSLDKAVGPNLTAKLNITFIVTNPNKNYNISYDGIVVALDYGRHRCKDSSYFCMGLLASTRFPSFLHLRQSENTLPFQINVVDQIIGNSIVDDRARGSIDFGLKLVAGFHTDEFHTMEFYCKRLRFMFKTNNDTFAYGTCMSRPSLTFD